MAIYPRVAALCTRAASLSQQLLRTRSNNWALCQSNFSCYFTCHLRKYAAAIRPHASVHTIYQWRIYSSSPLDRNCYYVSNKLTRPPHCCPFSPRRSVLDYQGWMSVHGIDYNNGVKQLLSVMIYDTLNVQRLNCQTNANKWNDDREYYKRLLLVKKYIYMAFMNIWSPHIVIIKCMAGEYKHRTKRFYVLCNDALGD